MKDLRDKADTGPDVDRIEDAEQGTYRVSNPALYSADAISPEGDYPFFGDWLKTDNGYLECPAALAAELVDAVDTRALSFPVDIEIDSARKVDGSWTVDARVSEAD